MQKNDLKLIQKGIFLLVILACLCSRLTAQISAPKFGKGIQFLGQDSSYYLKFGFRFQNLVENEWTIQQTEVEPDNNFKAKALVRRARLKFNGWIHNSTLRYKMELGLTNRDVGGGAGSEFNKAANIVLDAFMQWDFYKNFTLQFGQAKLPGNRERVISSANLQLVDRSILNAALNIDRDVGFQLKHHHVFGTQFLMREVIAFSQGEGRNITAGHFNGFNYTFRLEALPFGKFQSKGDYVAVDLKREPKPKLAIGLTYDINNNSVRERGQRGRFIQDVNGLYYGKKLQTFFADMMLKYNGFSFMLEYAHKTTDDGSPIVLGADNEVVGLYYTGESINLQAGYLFENNWELATRFTAITPDIGVASKENQYTLGLSKYIVGHQLKVQTDITYKEIDQRNDKFVWRMQLDVHF